MKKAEYEERSLREQERIIKDEIHGVGDRDIHNLELIMYSIRPGSLWFNRGCISSIRKAIKAIGVHNEVTPNISTYSSTHESYQTYTGYSCPICGFKIEKDYNWCPGCGSELNWKGVNDGQED